MNLEKRLERIRRNQAYVQWRTRVIAEGTLLRPIPDNYSFLEQYPNNFKAVRDEFHIEWLTQKLTKPF